jgi:hypothetical protein
MIPMERVRALELAEGAGSDNSRRVQAASGLVIVDDTLYVVSDDQLYLAIFPDMGRDRGRVVRLLEGHLSSDPKERKDDKPDLESLSPLAPFGRFPRGGLITLGSGSSERRVHGAFAAFGADGSIDEVVDIEAHPLLEALGERIPGLNLEGTAVSDGVFRVLQRGNSEGSINAHIDLDLERLGEQISDGGPLTEKLLVDIHEHDLGQMRGVRLCFSDADTLDDDRIVFSASAEPDEGGGDGASLGSAVGLMSVEGEILELEPVDVQVKVEGLAVVQTNDSIEAYMVTDEDDPDIPTDLWRLRLPWS